MRTSSRVALTLALAFALTARIPQLGWSQTYGEAQAPAAANSKASTEKGADSTAPGEGSASLRAGTRIATQLESTVDARTAKPGDDVTARVTKNVKQDGQVVVHKGDRLIGHITDVQVDQSAEGGSRMAITFDRLTSGEATSQLNTVVTSMSSAGGLVNGQESLMSEPMPTAVGGGGGGTVRSGGSMLGSAVGSLGSSATGTARTTLGGTTGALGSTAGKVGATGGASGAGNSAAGVVAPLRSVRLNSEAQGNGQAGTSSVLSARRGDLRLDSGTNMEFRVSGQAESEATK
jgi:hypothetical protein